MEEEAHAPTSFLNRRNILTLLSLLFVVSSLFASLRQLAPPDAVPATAPAEEFSSGRALEHLKVIGREPHPLRSSQHAEVRNYILRELSALNVNPEVQQATVSYKKWGDISSGNTIHNIVARLRGAATGKALLLCAHYDTVAQSPGASDDASGVAVLLETLRALESGPKLKNDVILLFTDGEEAGLLGARAFADLHPWAQDVGQVLNFEARGTGGPAVMFETSSGNEQLIEAFARAAPYPVTNSFAYDIYRLLPNDTDLTVFKEKGKAGLNFAFIDNAACYHTPGDNLENLSERSLQHQGSYALGLTRYLGNATLKDEGGGDAVYFSVPGSQLIYYRQSYVIALMSVMVLLFLGVTALGFVRKKLTLAGMISGLLIVFFNIVGVLFFITLFAGILSRLRNEYLPTGQCAGPGLKLCMAGLMLMTFAIGSAGYSFKRANIQDLYAGGLLCWVVLMVLCSLFLPGGSYLFTWPLLFGLIMLTLLCFTQGDDVASVGILTASSVAALPGIVLVAPFIYLSLLALNMGFYGVVMVMWVLLLVFLIPHLLLWAARYRWLPAGASALLGLGFMLAALFLP